MNGTANFMAIMAARIAETQHAKRRNAPPLRPAPTPAPPPPTPPAVEADAFTLEEIAARMKVSKRTVRGWNLRTFKIGRVVRVRRQDFDIFLSQHTAAEGE